MNVLLDTNIVLDILLHRDPWFTTALLFRQALLFGRIRGYVAASAVTDIFYLASRHGNVAVAQGAVQQCLTAFTICIVDRAIIEAAASMPGDDFEDNVQIACAIANRVDLLVTRDATGFRNAPISALTPEEAVRRLNQR